MTRASASFALDRLDQERLLLPPVAKRRELLFLLDPVPAIGPALRPSPANDR